MNLFTRFLTSRNRNQPLTTFVAQWDALEALIISVFKSKRATTDDLAQYAELRQWLVANYPNFAVALKPIWEKTLVGGELAPTDPFSRLFVHDSAEKFIGDWVAMQNLAAAREALNRLVIEQADS